MMYRKPITLTAIAVFSLAVAAGTFAQSKADPVEDQVRALMKQKQEVLEQRVQLLRETYLRGSIPFDEVLAARNDLLEVELELAASMDERLSILESQLQNLRQLEELTKRHFATGQAPQADLLGARAARLGAEIAVLRAR